MIQIAERYFGYLLVRCADEERDEELNVGVVVFDQERSKVECRFASSLDRVERNLPNVPLSHVRLLLEQAQETASDVLEEIGVEGLLALSHDPHGTIRFSSVRSISGKVLEHTAEDLLRRYVELPEPLTQRGSTGSTSSDPHGNQVSSRRVISAVETRLKRRGLGEGREYHSNVILYGRTEGALRLPIRFPLRIGQRIYIDGLEVKTDLERTLERSRSIAQKVLEAHRAEETARINVLIRDPWMGDDGKLAEAIVSEGAEAAGDLLTVQRYSAPDEIDDWMKETLQPAFGRM